MKKYALVAACAMSMSMYSMDENKQVPLLNLEDPYKSPFIPPAQLDEPKEFSPIKPSISLENDPNSIWEQKVPDTRVPVSQLEEPSQNNPFDDSGEEY